MATGNFKTMEDFPLIVADDMMIKVCPECGICVDGDADKCECGRDLSDVESQYDDIQMRDLISEMEDYADRMNHEQDFYTVSVEGGYYSGVQFYVDEKYYDVENWTNEDAQNEFGMCRSKMLRLYTAAGNKIRRELRKAKNELGLIELGVMARFSNGETIYSKVS